MFDVRRVSCCAHLATLWVMRCTVVWPFPLIEGTLRIIEVTPSAKQDTCRGCERTTPENRPARSRRWPNLGTMRVLLIYLIGNFDEVGPAWAGGKGDGLVTGPDFLIPAGATNHQEVNRFWLDDGGDFLARSVPISVWMVGTTSAPT